MSKENQLPLYESHELSSLLNKNVSQTSNACAISIDTRTLKAGDIFFALPGQNYQGSDFCSDALAKGAVFCITDKVNPKLEDDERIIIVQDVFSVLERFAQIARERMQGRLIGITGSVGKTSSKEMLKVCLSSQAETIASERSYNNHIGLPLSLASVPKNCDFAILEMGMNHPGELTLLSNLAKPDIAVITTIAAVHLEFFRSVEQIAYAKAEIFNGMNGGYAVINRDNQYHSLLLRKALDAGLEVVDFGEDKDASTYLLDYKLMTGVSHIRASIMGEEVGFEMPTPGKHNALNAIAALSVVKILGKDIKQAAKQLVSFTPVKGRGKVYTSSSGFKVIDESYNSSPIAVKAALENLASYRKGERLIAVLGDMKELGNGGARLHADLSSDIETHGIDIVYTFGSLMRNLADALMEKSKYHNDSDVYAMIEKVKAEVKPGDVVLVKGSRGMRMEKIVESLIEESI